MSVENINKIDFMGIPENEPDVVSLAISDHLAWGSATNEHLYKLQEKINSYIRFIEGGEIKSNFPTVHKDAKKRIEIYFKNNPPDEVMFFFDEVEKVLAEVGVSLRLKLND